MLKSYFLVLVLSLAALTSQADIQFTTLNVDDGMSQNSILAIAQDQHGFMWFGTEDGLNRFDGFDIKIIRNNSGDLNSLSNNKINALQVDSTGRFWIGTAKGLNFWDYENNCITRIDDSDAYDVQDIALHDDGTLWLATQRSGVIVFNPQQNTFLPLAQNDKLVSQLNELHLTELAFDKQMLWLGTRASGFFKYDLSNQKLTAFDDDGQISSSSGTSNVRDIAVDSNGDTWISTFTHGLYENKHSSNRLVTQRYVNDLNTFVTIEDLHGNFWAGSYENGLYTFNPPSKSIKNYHKNINSVHDLPSNTIFSLFIDHSNQLWVGTDAGVARYNINSDLFGYASVQNSNNETGPNNVMRIEQDAFSNIWIGTHGDGLIRYNEKSDTYIRYLPDPKINSIASHQVIALEQAVTGLWIGTSNGLDYLDFKSQHFEHFKTVDHGGPLLDNNIHALLLDSKDNLWIGTYHEGVQLRTPNSNKFQHFSAQSGNSNSLSHHSILGIFESSLQDILVITEQGLNKYHPERNNFEQISFIQDPPYISAIWEDGKTRLWIGSRNGVYLLNSSFELLLHLTTANGLSNNSITGILEDNTGKIWISTNNGLNRFHPETGDIDNFFREHGLQSNEFNFAYNKLNDGRLLFGGVNGYNLFDPTDIKIDQTPAKPVIANPKLLGPGGSQQDSIQNRIMQNSRPNLTITHEYYGLEIQFHGLHYKAPARNKYRYMLEGLDQDWFNASGSDNTVRYTNLAPSDYTFRLEVANSDGFRNLNPATISIRVLPPWWKTIWAYAGYVISVLMLVFAVYRWRTHSLRLLVEIRTRELEHFYENTSHEFRTAITLILSTYRRLKPNLPSFDFERYLSTGIDHANRLLRLVNQMLDKSRYKAGVWQLNPGFFPLSEQVQQIANQFLPEIQTRQLELNLTLQKDLVFYYDEYAMETVMVNLISNAIKFTPAAGIISIAAYIEGNRVIINVKDTGKGIPSKDLERIFKRYQQSSYNQNRQTGSGIGLSLALELTKAIGGLITPYSEVGKGSSFTLSFPFDPQYDEPQPLSKRYDDTNTSRRLQSPPLPYQSRQALISDNNKSDKNLVLIVDDEPDMLEHLTDVLCDYEALTAKDGQQGINLALQYLPDVIVSDVMMPNVNGIELARTIRKHPHTSHIPIIIVTARSGHDSRLAGLSEGVIDVIVKPFDEDELRWKIHNLLEVRETYASNWHKLRIPGAKNQAQQTISISELPFLNMLNIALAEEFHQPDFGVKQFAKKVHLTERQLQRKMKAAYNQTPGTYMRHYRLEQATRMLIEGHSVTQTAEACGFTDISIFSRCFKARFGHKPSQHRDIDRD